MPLRSCPSHIALVLRLVRAPCSIPNIEWQDKYMSFVSTQPRTIYYMEAERQIEDAFASMM